MNDCCRHHSPLPCARRAVSRGHRGERGDIGGSGGYWGERGHCGERGDTGENGDTGRAGTSRGKGTPRGERGDIWGSGEISGRAGTSRGTGDIGGNGGYWGERGDIGESGDIEGNGGYRGERGTLRGTGDIGGNGGDIEGKGDTGGAGGHRRERGISGGTRDIGGSGDTQGAGTPGGAGGHWGVGDIEGNGGYRGSGGDIEGNGDTGGNGGHRRERGHCGDRGDTVGSEDIEGNGDSEGSGGILGGAGRYRGEQGHRGERGMLREGAVGTAGRHCEGHGDTAGREDTKTLERCRAVTPRGLCPRCPQWKDVLDGFCTDEFGVKTRQFHCCRLHGAARRRCFSQETPAPTWDPAPAGGPSVAWNLVTEPPFPPGEPTAANLGNICGLRTLRPGPPGPGGRSGPRVRLRVRLEREYERCCRNESLSCAHSAWLKGLNRFCREESSVKTGQHRCCQRGGPRNRGRCFAAAAPHPEYDRELTPHPPSPPPLLFGRVRSPHAPWGLLGAMTSACCPLPHLERGACAQEQLSQGIATLCATPEDAWRDPQGCCALEEPERRRCFDSSYLSQVTLGAAVAPPAPGHEE
uniref:Uncharacterized protein n=2 Tax=Catharus TaxID=9184 RepID=A0A8C3UU96_CATUS